MNWPKFISQHLICQSQISAKKQANFIDILIIDADEVKIFQHFLSYSNDEHTIKDVYL